MRIVRPIVLAAASLAALPPALHAAPLFGAQLAQRIVNAEFRGYTHTRRGFENQIWHFLPDGRIRAVAESSRIISLHGHHHEQWQDIGAWRLAGDRLCVSFQGLNHDINGCYAIDAGPGKNVRLVGGPYSWQGTLEPYGY
jgi:hypothetical protein